ncbi:MAG: hypothetical protein ACRDNW_24470 [Trebonia sp.]
MSVTYWIIIAIVTVGILIALFGLDRYRGSRERTSGSAAQPTDEVFIDPETGRTTRVW